MDLYLLVAGCSYCKRTLGPMSDHSWDCGADFQTMEHIVIRYKIFAETGLYYSSSEAGLEQLRAFCSLMRDFKVGLIF